MSFLHCLCFALCALMTAEILCQKQWIRFLRKKSVSQKIKEYGPERHLKEKGDTPTMGGVVFLCLFLPALFWGNFFLKDFPHLWLCLSFPLGMALVGLTDDLLKFSSCSSEGFRSAQKFIAQCLVAGLWLFFVYQSKTYLFCPFSRIADIMITLFLGVGIVNAVNITDGLDGLASLTALESFLMLGLAGFCEGNTAVVFLSTVGFSLSGGFLWHNCYPAEVFMGDAGSHFLGGLLFTASCFFSNPWILLPASSIFTIEILSVILQLTAIHVFERKIFAMSPLHHHFELQGVKETHIVIRFAMIHGLSMLILFALYFGTFA